MEGLTYGRFRDLVPLGEGGMGQIFLARAVGPGGFAKPVVLKRMHESIARVPSLVERFLEEARVQANLVCPNIVQVLDFGRMDDSYFLVLEYVHGVDLGVMLRSSSGGLPIGVATRIAADACRGLDYAHRARGPSGESLHLVHRDVSPQNLLVSYEGDAKLGDFGLVRTTAASDPVSSTIIGKPAYLSPEQARGGPGDARSDVYALGTVLYFALTGVQPLRGADRAETLRRASRPDVEPVERLRPEIPASLAALVARAMRAEPSERFPDAATMRSELESIALSLGHEATIAAVRDHMHALFPGAAERDPWSGRAGAVTLELSRLVAEDGLTVLTAHDVPVPARAPLRWRTAAALLGALAVMAMAVVLVMGGGGPAERRTGRRAVDADRAAAEPHPGTERSSKTTAPDRGTSSTALTPRTTDGAAGGAPTPPAGAQAPGADDATASAKTSKRGAPAGAHHPAGPPLATGTLPPPPPVAAVTDPPARGRLRVGSAPGWGWVTLDGRRIGSTPLDVEVAAGDHQLRVVAERSGRERVMSVHVEPAATRIVFLDSFE